MARQLDLDAVRAFVAFAEELNFTKAAIRLHISQPALYAKVHKLSGSLGQALYERVGRNLRLTEAGEAVARLGREINDLSEGFLEEMATGENRRPVVLAAGEGAYLYLLGDPIRAFSAKSQTPLRLLTRNASGTLEAVRSGAAHLGVAVLDVLPNDLEAHLLVRVPEILVVPRGHPLSRQGAVKLRDLKGARLIVPPADRPHRLAIERALQSADVQWDVALEATGWELMLRFVQMGLGMAIVNGCCHLPSGVVGVPLVGLPETRYYVVNRKGALAKGSPSALLKRLLEETKTYEKGWR